MGAGAGGFKVAEAYVELQARGLDQVDKALGGTRAGMMSLMGSATALGGVFTVGALAGGLANCVKSFGEAEMAGAKLDAVLKSTKNAAGMTGDDIRKMTSDLQRLTTFEDDAGNSAAAMLLTFKEIKGDVFKQAFAAAQDLSIVMGQDLRSSIMQVGKALQDPVAGINALRRAGVSFDDQQKDLIKSLVENNRLLDAQKMILAELNSEFGGAAAAAADTMTGRITQMKNAWGDLAETVGGEVAPALKLLAELLADLARGKPEAAAPVAIDRAVSEGKLKAIRDAQAALIREEGELEGKIARRGGGRGTNELQQQLKDNQRKQAALREAAEKASREEWAKKAATSVLGVPGNAPPISKDQAAAAIAGAFGGTKPKPKEEAEKHGQNLFKFFGGMAKEMQKIREEGERLMKEFETPQERLQSKFKEIERVQKAGGLTAEQADKAKQAAAEGFTKSQMQGVKDVHVQTGNIADFGSNLQVAILEKEARKLQEANAKEQTDRIIEQLKQPMKIDPPKFVLG